MEWVNLHNCHFCLSHLEDLEKMLKSSNIYIFSLMKKLFKVTFFGRVNIWIKNWARA